MRGIAVTQTMSLDWPSLLAVVGAAGGALLLVGLGTPFAGWLGALTELLNVVSGSAGAACHLELAALALSLAMTGPGAWSIDARLFGRKRNDF
jgi:putative oxidoreductase